MRPSQVGGVYLFCSSVRYIAHLYCLAVQAGFYGDVGECLLHMRRVAGSIISRLKYAPVAQLIVCPLWGMGGHEFDSGPRHTKVVKMVLAAPRLAL